LQAGVKIAICGKGGVGKTTVCAVWARLFAEQGLNVLAIDADSNANLASAFGLAEKAHPEPLIRLKDLIAERTGADKGSIGAYFKLNPAVSDLPEQYWLKINEHLRLLVLGDITQAGAGCACPESAFLKAMLSHIVLQRKELVLVDLAAGVEFMGRATVQGVDVLVVVVEPGSRSIDTADNIAKMARQLGIKHLAVIANKVTSAEQTELIKAQFKDIPVLAGIQYFTAVQQADLQRAGVFESCDDLVNTLRQAKDRLMDLVNIKVKSS
jgi:CO dehydrogenase maturation factor